MRPFRFYEQCKYATVADIYSMTFFVVMNKKKYESLPPDIRKIIDDNSGLQMAVKAGRAYDQADIPGKKLFEDKGGTVYPLPAAEKEKWMKASMPIKTNWIKDMDAKGLPGKEVLDYAEAQLSKMQ
jgi:TRAP-type C4-dicarboxylate transport system substrate-binding protein